MPVVASSAVGSVSAWATITPDRSTPRWSFFQPRLPRPPCFAAAPFALADDRQARAVDDEMKRPPGRNAIENEIETLTPPRERGVIWRFEVGAHQDQDRPQEALGLAQGQPEDEPERQCGLDREVREFPRPARPTRRRRSPRVHRVVGEPECHVASPHEGSFVLRPVSDVIFRLVLRVHPRIHEEIVRQLPSATPVDPRLHSGRSRADLHQRHDLTGLRGTHLTGHAQWHERAGRLRCR